MVAIPSKTLSIAKCAPSKQNKHKLFILQGVLFSFFLAWLLIQWNQTHNQRIHCLKQTHPNFVGREKIFKEILESWKRIRGHPAYILLWGKPGIGKTEAAIAFGNYYSKHFKLTYFLNCETEELLYENYQGLLQKLRLPLFENESLQNLRKRVHDQLGTEKFRWLLIFDNVWKPIPLPERGNGVCLLTSRNGSLLSSAEAIEIPSFSEEESLKLVEKILPERSGETWDPLIKKWEGLPIMLAESLQYLKQVKICDVQSYLELIKDGGNTILNVHPNDDRYGQNYSAAFEVAFREIEQFMPLAASFLEVAAHLHPDGIPKSWIQKHLTLNQLTSLEASEITANEIAGYLTNHGYLRYDAQKGVFSIHRLIQNLIRSVNARNKRGLCQSLRILTSGLNTIYEPTFFENYFSSREHVTDWIVNALWFKSHIGVGNFENGTLLQNRAPFDHFDLEEHENLVNLLLGIGLYYNNYHEQYIKSSSYYQEAMRYFSHCGSQNCYLQIKIIAYSAFNFACMNAYSEAFLYYQKAISKCKELNDHFLEGRYLSEYGWACMDFDLRKSLELTEQAEEILSAQPVNYLCEMAWILRVKGIIAIRENRFEEAHTYLIQALETNQQFFHDQLNPQRLFILRHLGILYRTMNMPEKAIEFLAMALEEGLLIYKTPFSLSYATINFQLCAAYFQNGSIKKALKIGNEVIKILSKLFPDEPYDFELEQLMLIIEIQKKLNKKKGGKETFQRFLSTIPRTKYIRERFCPKINKYLEEYREFYGEDSLLLESIEHMKNIISLNSQQEL